MGFNHHDFIPNDYFYEKAVQQTETPPAVVYIYEPTVGNYHYGPNHPMKPYRLTLTNDLIMHYGLYKHMKCYYGRRGTVEDLAKFHDPEYIEFLRRVCDEKTIESISKIDKMKMKNSDDCPIFPGIYDFCTKYSGSTLEAVKHIIDNNAEIAINWSGGLHHAKKSEPSGFCYINDITLGIIEFLRVYPRVLYIDIDVHHGDGVQESFYNNDRVFTLSFHKYGGGFFPGTGAIEEIGMNHGLGFSLNIPLRNGIDDAGYHYVFKHIASEVIEQFKPSVIVMQCGADSIGGDRLGCFNLSIRGHAECVNYIRKFNIPLLILGGGGYTVRNVSRLWAYETSLLCNVVLDDKIPETSPHREYFSPDYTLTSNLYPQGIYPIINENTRKYLDELLEKALSSIRQLQGAPSVAFQTIPVSDIGDDEMTEEDYEILKDPRAMEIVERLKKSPSTGYMNNVQ